MPKQYNYSVVVYIPEQTIVVEYMLQEPEPLESIEESVRDDLDLAGVNTYTVQEVMERNT